MAVDGNDILQVAENCTLMACESGYRSCISRAYYGMFHETMNSLTCVPHFSSNHHANLIGYMTNAAEHKAEPFESRSLKILGYTLKQQRDARNEADYHLKEVTVSEDMAKASLEAAKLYFSKWYELKSNKLSISN